MAQIVLCNVSNDEKYFPQRRDMFNDARWNEAKRLFAQVLKQHSKEAGRRSSRFLQDRMVGGDFPAPSGGYHNGITCIANGGEHSQQRGRVYGVRYYRQLLYLRGSHGRSVYCQHSGGWRNGVLPYSRIVLLIIIHGLHLAAGQLPIIEHFKI